MYQKRVLVVDDVITGGTAIRESYDMLTLIGAVPMGVVIALDRAEKRALDDPISAVQAVVRDMNIPVISIVNMPQLQLYLEQSPDFDEDVLTSVSEYRAQYGV
jgi:orotate phosphoribosyltransferase